MRQALTALSRRTAIRPDMGIMRTPLILFLLALLLLCSGLVSLGAGAIKIPTPRIIEALFSLSGDTQGLASDAMVILQIRLPRLLIAVMAGASLAVSGALLQGLFRNPLADPGIVGISSGASLAAAFVIVMGEKVLAPWIGKLPFQILPIAAFIGALASVLLLSALATRQGRTSVVTMLLAGIALAAFCNAFFGLLSYMSDDRQLRDITFWTMGSLGGATWTKVTAITPLILPILILVPLLARSLNALALGEAEAFHLGIPVQRAKLLAIFCVAIAVGASVAACGLIGFVGIVVPHMLRLAFGPDHKLLLPASALGGAILLVNADSIARTIVAPAELPIGILTALIGAPFFLWLLLYRREGISS